MKACDKKWKSKNHTSPQDKDVFEWGWRESLEWAQEVIIERLKLVSYDDNINCVRNIQEDIRNELGAPPAECVRDGYRNICKQCPEVQRNVCKAESAQ